MGDVFEFSFDGSSTLLFGPNGSGKSSLLNAIVWVLTGAVVTDCEDDSAEMSMYGPAKGGGRGTKLRDWPVVHTLPHDGDPRTVSLDCWAELWLKADGGGRTLHLRRALDGRLEESRDGDGWHPCASLSAHGIEALDLQLSISAATIFGRSSIEAADDTRKLLSMMLGFDTLEEIGTLLTNLATNLTKAINSKNQTIKIERERLLAKLAVLPGRLRDGLDLRDSVLDLVGDELPRVEAVVLIRDIALKRVKDVENELAHILGIDDTSSPPPSGLADALTAAVVTLERPWGELFPSLASTWSTVRGLQDGADGSESQLARITNELAAFEIRATAMIEARHDLWKRENSQDRKLGLMVQAAAHYDSKGRLCPVCERSIEGLPVDDLLRSLKDLPPELRTSLRDFFGNLGEELGRLTTGPVSAIGATGLGQGLRADWDGLKASIGRLLSPIVERYELEVRGLTETITVDGSNHVDVVPHDAAAAFRLAAHPFLARLETARKGLATLRWATTNPSVLIENLVSLLLTTEEAEPKSLASVLARGKFAAADVSPVAMLHDDLGMVVEGLEAINASEVDQRLSEVIQAALEEVKPLGKFAEAEVERVFGDIKDTTIDNLRKLYPYASPNVIPKRLHLNKGRDKSVEAYLAGKDFEVAGQHIANAGLLRAVALAFYFALLDRHPGGLGFIIMDDPILSLDDDHREAWASNVLRPALLHTQVILATHQKQFLNNCRSDFHPGRLVELNPRTRGRHISYRPGDRLDRAEELLDGTLASAPNEMRKYCEDLLITLDVYSPEPFYHRSNATHSVKSYEALLPPNPLAHPNRSKIAARLTGPKVCRVLNPGSHAMTEADITDPMIRDCLAELRALDLTFRNELDRLEALRLRDLHSKAVVAPLGSPSMLVPIAASTASVVQKALSTIPFEKLRVGDDGSSWDSPAHIDVIGAAAAKGRGFVVDMSDDCWRAEIPPGVAVLVASEGLLPITRPGQWALLSATVGEVADGDLVALIDRNGNSYLRRIWSSGDTWYLEAVNPLSNLPPVAVRKRESCVRRVVGISYGPKKAPSPGKGRRIGEWLPRGDFSIDTLSDLRGVTIKGTSLEPIASEGQIVLVDCAPAGRPDGIRSGGLAVVETNDDDVGNVIKRVFPGRLSWLLVSPNSIDPHDPITVAAKDIRAVWQVRGVLFDAH